MSWGAPEALETLIAASCWLLVPGVLACYALGLRGFVAWAVAPAVSSTIIALAAVLAHPAGWFWSPYVAAAMTCAVATVVVAVRVLRRRGGGWRELGRTAPPDPGPVQRAAWGGLVPAVAIGALIVIRGMRTPDAVSQTYDAVFHYNALRWILDSGNASALTLGNLGSAHAPAYYPAAWHDVASLAASGAGASIPVAANITAAVIAVLCWPLACMFLSRQVFGPSVRALVLTGVVSAGFGAFPWGLLGFGVLWPNALGLAMVPIGLGAGLSLTGLAACDALSPGTGWVVLVTVVVGTGLAQPNATFSLGVLLLFPCCHALVRWIRRQLAAQRTARVIWCCTGIGGCAVAGWSWLRSVPMVEQVKDVEWAPYATMAQAVGEALLNATNGRSALWLLSAAVVVGAVVAARGRASRWLPLAHVAVAVLFVFCAAVQSPMTRSLTGFWFNDSYRLAATLPITGVPLAVGGVMWTADALHQRLHRWTTPQVRPRLMSLAACTALLGSVLLAATLRYQAKAVQDIRKSYPALTDASSSLVSARELGFFARIKHRVPPGAVVANNPWNGSALLWAFDGVRVLFPQLSTMAASADQRYLALHFNQAATDPRVCRIAAAQRVEYLVNAQARFWTGDPRVGGFPGFADPAGRPGFQLVDQEGAMKLYRLTACPTRPGPRPGGP